MEIKCETCKKADVCKYADEFRSTITKMIAMLGSNKTLDIMEVNIEGVQVSCKHYLEDKSLSRNRITDDEYEGIYRQPLTA